MMPFALTIFFVFSQNGFQFMTQANNTCAQRSHCSPSRSSYFDSDQSIISMRLSATNMARSLCQNSEMIQIAASSSDVTHRVAAAFACGMKREPNEIVYMLAADSHPIVSQAAREALVFTARIRNNKPNIDFGPFHDADMAQKEDSVKLWRLFFQANPKIEITKSQPIRKEETNTRGGTKCVKYAPPCNPIISMKDLNSADALRIEAALKKSKPNN